MTDRVSEAARTDVSSIANLRALYPADNPIGLMLDRFAEALPKGVADVQLIADGEALLIKIDGNRTAARYIRQALRGLVG